MPRYFLRDTNPCPIMIFHSVPTTKLNFHVFYIVFIFKLIKPFLKKYFSIVYISDIYLYLSMLFYVNANVIIFDVNKYIILIFIWACLFLRLN